MAISKIPMRRIFVGGTLGSILLIEALSWTLSPWARLAYIPLAPLVTMGIRDMRQTKQAIRRNFPLLGRFRYLMEAIRPEINQYFVESNIDGRPFDRIARSNIYQRAKRVLNTHPFGTETNVYEVGAEWMGHSMAPIHPPKEEPRVMVGGKDCQQPYSASILNISAMSYGSLSKNAILALNKGAKHGGFYHNTGEGGLSPYHLEGGGDIVWQLGTGYFGARTRDGKFCPDTFQEKVANPQIKMVEIKISQGAKPGHGGILPAAKVTPEISEIRGVVMGEDVISPPYHQAFSSPLQLIEFIAQLRERSKGKPIGIKFCVGKHHEVLALCKAMHETGITPDFITVDGGEGGTGAAPIEFSDSVGIPLTDGLLYVHNALIGFNLRDKIRVIASGKVTTGFHLAQKMALGADICNSARGMMFALGCIQALQCHTNDCPTGVATQNTALVNGLVVTDKYKRVANFHHETIKSFLELLSACGYSHPKELSPKDIYRRVTPTEILHYGQIYTYLHPGDLLEKLIPPAYEEAFRLAQVDSFSPRALSQV